MNKTTFFSPLEQFQVLPIIKINFGFIDLSITNELVILLLIFVLSSTLMLSLLNKNNTLYLIPSRWQSLIELIYKTILSLVLDNIRNDQAQKFFPLVFTTFLFILSLNTIGLVPYSFTLTSHLIVTFTIALALFIGINIICVRKHGIKFFTLFLPAGTGVSFAFLLIPIEFISYFFKPVSLSIRLFANMMAGHTLLKVIAGFGFVLMGKSGIFFLMHFVPLIILIPLYGLELAVALIQSFVFSILICIYLNDAINLH
jgi:ATP synthase subunit 6